MIQPALPLSGLQYCERRTGSHQRNHIATHLLERQECSSCGFRHVINICDTCVAEIERIIKNNDAIVSCPQCHRPKPHTSLRIIGKI